MCEKNFLSGRRGLLASASLFVIVGCGGTDPDVASREAAVAPGGDSLPAAPGKRPPTVPEGYVATPNGYFHQSCVVELAADETMGADHKIHRPDGRTRDIAPCAHARYDGQGHAVAPEAGPSGGKATATRVGALSTDTSATRPPSINSWVETAVDDHNGPLNWISANFTVPSNPAMDSSQLLYYFPGLMPIVDGTHGTIMQPVLKYFGGAWSIASWNCCVDGVTSHSEEAPVNSGDTLYGYIQGNNCDGDGLCKDWQVYTGDWRTGASTTLNTTSYGSIMGDAFGGAVEVYGLDDCAQYPTSGGIAFTNLQVRNTKYLSVYPTWSPVIWPRTPSCGYGVSSPDTSTVELFTGSTTVPSPATPASCGVLNPSEGLGIGQSLSSCDGRFTLTLQPSGNLVLNQGATTLWASNTTGAYAAEMMSGGDFVLWSSSSKQVWSTGARWGDAHLAVQNDGNVVLYTSDGTPRWATNTCCR